MNVGHVLAQARRRSGLSQAELAARVGTSQPTISAYENGGKQPSVATLSRLLSAMGARLTVDSKAPPIIEPSWTEHARTARTLHHVLELAAALPSRHEPNLRYPRLSVR